MKSEIVSQLREILIDIRKQAPHHLVTAEGDFVDSLGLDSLDLANFATEIEVTFQVSLDTDIFRHCSSLAKLSSFLATNSAAEHAPCT